MSLSVLHIERLTFFPIPPSKTARAQWGWMESILLFYCVFYCCVGVRRVLIPMFVQFCTFSVMEHVPWTFIKRLHLHSILTLLRLTSVVEFSSFYQIMRANHTQLRVSYQSQSLIIWALSQPCDSQINSVSINEFSESPLHFATEILYSKDTHSQTA